MCPFLLSVELGPPVRCALVSIRATCRTFRTLWINDASTREAAITHTESMIRFYAGMSRSDFQAYINAALGATVIHPLRLGSGAIARISMDSAARAWPRAWPAPLQRISSITVIAQFTFKYKDVHRYFHVAHMSIPDLLSTGHWISTRVNDCEVRFAVLCLHIGDTFDDGNIFMYAHIDFMEDGNQALKASHTFSQVNAIYSGANVADDEDWRSSTAFKNDELFEVEGYKSFSCDSGVAAALRKVEQDQTDLVISALVQVEVAIQNDDDEWLTIDSLQVSQAFEPGSVES